MEPKGSLGRMRRRQGLNQPSDTDWDKAWPGRAESWPGVVLEYLTKDVCSLNQTDSLELFFPRNIPGAMGSPESVELTGPLCLRDQVSMLCQIQALHR